MKKKLLIHIIAGVLLLVAIILGIVLLISSQNKDDIDNDKQLKASEGLNFTLNEDGESYSLVGIGTCKDTEIIIPNKYDGLPVTKITSQGFKGCDFITSITIPKHVTDINISSITCSSLVNIDVNKDNRYYKSIDGNLYSKDGKTLIKYAIGKTETSFTIPNSVTRIGEHAFYAATNLTNITISNSVKTIGYGAFMYCKIKSIEIPNSVISIEDFAFSNCYDLKKVTIPNSVTSLGYRVFIKCDTSLTIYCEATSQPSGWDSEWNSSNRTVIWGYNKK